MLPHKQAPTPSACPERPWDTALSRVSLLARAGPPEGVLVPLITSRDLPLTRWSMF